MLNEQGFGRTQHSKSASSDRMKYNNVNYLTPWWTSQKLSNIDLMIYNERIDKVKEGPADNLFIEGNNFAIAIH